MNIAMISPNYQAVSETFIKAQKELLAGNVKYYHTGMIPEYLEDRRLNRGLHKLYYRFYGKIVLSKKFYDYRHAFKVSLRREKIDVALAQFGFTGVECLDICMKLKIPLLVYFYGGDVTCRKVLDEYETRYPAVFDYASALFVVSCKMRDDLIKLGAPAGKIIVNHCGPDEDFFKINHDINSTCFIAVGRFTDKKAPYHTILAFERVLRKYPEARLIMAGDGELLPLCKNISCALKISHAVDFPGFISHEQEKQLMAKCCAFVQHSIKSDDGDSEGTPVAITEASAAGLPVVSTLHAGIPDVIVNGQTGWLVEEHDAEGMADAMINILADPAAAVSMGLAGRHYIQDNFNMSKHIAMINSAIEKCVK